MCLHYTIRNLYSVVYVNKVMLKAGKEKKKQGHIQQHNFG